MEIDQIITDLKKLKLDTNPVNDVTRLLSQVGDIGYMSVNLHKGASIIRARPNNKDGRFVKKSDFSFKPPKFNTTYQRASTPFQTMFYGCILPEVIEPGELENARVIGALESMPWLRNKTESGYEKISFGRWFVEEDLKLIAIIHKDSYYSKSSYTRELVNAYQKFISQQDANLTAKSLKFQYFLADEFSKEIKTHQDYMISAIFSEVVVNNKNHEIDGILYPSVRTAGEGFNVAIKPESCSKMGLYVAGECSVYKLRDHTIVGNDAIVQLDGKTDEFEMIEIENHRAECLQKLGLRSIEELIEAK